MERAAREAGVTLWCVVRANGPVRRSDAAELFTFTYLPFEQLLEHAAGLILHGGQGSALAALRYGVPSLAIPGRHYERRYNSERIAALGAGLHGQLTDLRTGRLTTILAQMLAGGSMAENARRAGTSTPAGRPEPVAASSGSR
ncbi:UDP:flavonoid glycosyltransferase YjiC (YdhE family) [Actinoplanes tereljensis]|uniref:Erythromycin biosynthesis protein CIII-like C-terminal domain-containing protein n=1 Tax=Paractinoplanes tereljensis TaxID=571912 RepID=A0A919NTD1_9ACTN|nr:nucleotide disphospho-sugar-binding domain-containing protein [Actinoplanes tereljensis]GIF23432.1 hypothetical protein Ate02nite_61620 [Actinoplanes tereljensis]